MSKGHIMEPICCGNCQYHELEDLSEDYICANEKSECFAEWTDRYDVCMEWREREQ